MKNLIIILFTLFIVSSVYGQKDIITVIGNPPIRPTKVERYTTNHLLTGNDGIWINTYNPKPPVKKVIRKYKGNTNKNLMIGNPVKSPNSKQDSINSETLRLLILYGQEIADLHKPLSKDTTHIKLSIVIKEEKNSSPIPPVIVIDTFQLSKQKRNGVLWCLGGFGTQVAGMVIGVNMYQPTEIHNTMRVTSKNIINSIEIKRHSKENLQAFTVIGGSIIIGGIMEYIGIDKLCGVHLKANGVEIPLFKKRLKNK